MANQYTNKVIINGVTKIDLAGDTVTESDILLGKTAHDKSGAPITGTCTYDSDTSDANALPAEILNTKTAYVSGQKVTGTMPNNGATGGSIDGLSVMSYSIPAGYTSGGTVTLTNDIETALAAI